MLYALFLGITFPAQAAIPRILYVGDSWTYYPWANQSPPALRAVLSRSDIVTAVGGTYEENGDIALHGATAEQWDSDSLKAEITQKLNEFPTIDIIHMSLGGNDVNLNLKGDFSQAHIDAMNSTAVEHIRNVINHCLSVRPNVRVAICGYDYLNIAEGYTYETWQNPYNPFEIITYVSSVQNPTLIALTLWGLPITIFNPSYPWLGWTTAQQIAEYQTRMDNVFINLERRKKNLALSMNRVAYIHSFGVMQAHYGIPSINYPQNLSVWPQGPPNYSNFPGGYSTLWSPSVAMAGSSEIDPIHLSPGGYTKLMENAVAQVYLSWLGDSTAPTVNSIVLASADPPAGASVDFTVNFSESVTGVDAADFVVDQKGTVTGAAITNVTGSGRTWTVTVSTPTGNGSLSIDLIDNNTIYDGVWNPLGGAGIDSFIQGQYYTIGTGAGGGPDSTNDCPVIAAVDAQGAVLYPLTLGVLWDNGDLDEDGLYDSWEAALLCEVLCRPSHPLYTDLRTFYNNTINALRGELYYDSLIRPVENLIAVLLLTDSAMTAKLKARIPDVLTKPYIPYSIYLGKWVQPFAPDTDLDADGLTNKQEYNTVRGLSGTRTDYVNAAITPACPQGIGPDVNFAASLKYLYELKVSIPLLLDEMCLVCKDPMTADLDENGIVDYAHAFMVDALLWCSNTKHYTEVATAFAYNKVVVKAYLDLLWKALSKKYWNLPVDQAIGLLVDINKVEHALTGMITIGEPAGLAMMIAFFDQANTYINPEDAITVNPANFSTAAVTIIGSVGDADDDGTCNLSEYTATSHDAAGFVAFASNALNPSVTTNGGGCDGPENNGGEEPAQCPALSVMDAEGATLYGVLPGSSGWAEGDIDGNGMKDSWELALIADVLCDTSFPLYQSARVKYTANLNRLMADSRYSMIRDVVHVMAALMTVSDGFAEFFKEKLALSGYYYPYRVPEVTGVVMLGGGGDPDGDTLSNKLEYNYVVNRGGTREDYVLAAKSPNGGNVDRCPGLCDGGSGPCSAVNFDALMQSVDKALTQFRSQLGGFVFDPGTADINGGFTINGNDIKVYGNGVIDSDEFALINHYLTHSGLNPVATTVCNAWNRNKSQMYQDLGGSSGLVNVMAPAFHQVLAAYMLLGDANSVAIPVTILQKASTVDLTGDGTPDLGITPVNMSNYTTLPDILALTADPDGDSFTNQAEYECFRQRSRCCYLLGASDGALFPSEGQCVTLDHEGEGTGEGTLEGEGGVEGEGGEEGEEGEGGAEGEINPCAVMACEKTCAYAEGINSGFERALRAIYANPLVNKNPDFADLDKNGIVDAAHARLLDVILADTTDVNYCCIRGAYDQNLALANAYADEVQAVQPVVFMMIPRTDVVPAVAGVMTLGEAATIAIITDQFDNAPIDIPSINISAFDRSSEKYLAFNGDADLDGVCNLGEYTATVDWIDDFDAFVAAARDPLALADGGGCPSCEGETEGALQEGEGGGEGETEGASVEGEGGGEGEGEGEGMPAEGEGGPDCLTFTSADVPVTINDMMQTNSTITIADDFIISDVNVMLDITHPAPGELTVWLMSPSATSIFLTIQRGGSGANFTQTIFDDQASVMIGLGTPPFTGRFIPDDTLSDLNGENAQGEWALIMFDGGQGNTGTLNGWSITFNNVCDFPGEGEVEGSISEGTPEEGEGSASEGEGNLGTVHSADWNGGPNGRIDLSELLRIIQFYNSGVFHCQSGTEDGYAPGSGDQSCAHHSGDYGPQDWSIGLSELLRIIQFYNSTGYHACTGSEDGFCPGQA